jgi:hypothetical protein
MTVIMSDSDKSHLDLIPTPGIPYSAWAKWARFELLLESYVEMIEQRRVIASSGPLESWNPKYGYSVDTDPWYLSQNDDSVVDATILAWNNLLSAIESRMPATAISNRQQLYSSASIEGCNIKGLFLKKFLQRARIPTFRYVAPGLRLASDEDLSNQAFKNADVSKLSRRSPGNDKFSSEYWCYPFLFLRFDQKTHLDPSCCYKKHLTGSEYRYNGYPWQHAMEFDTGLYITGARHIERPDGCKLLLSFPVTPDKWAKFGDGFLINSEHSYDGLYQPERASDNHWALMGSQGEDVQWNLRLEVLLKNWTSMIENGHWEVGEDGVLGGAEKFKEADSEDKWQLYSIERTW